MLPSPSLSSIPNRSSAVESPPAEGVRCASGGGGGSVDRAVDKAGSGEGSALTLAGRLRGVKLKLLRSATVVAVGPTELGGRAPPVVFARIRIALPVGSRNILRCAALAMHRRTEDGRILT